MKGGITGQSHRQGLALLHGDAGQGMRPRAGRLQQGDQAFQVQVLAGQSGPGLASLLGGLQFMGRGQAEMPARQGQGFAAWQAAQQWHLHALQHVGQQLPVPGAADLVEHHAGDAQLGIVIAESAHDGAEGGGLTTGIQHQHHRQVQQAGHVGRASGCTAADAIEEPHHPFHEGQLRGTAVTVKGLANPGFSAEIEIEVATGLPRGLAEQLGIEIVRSHLEGLDPASVLLGPAQQRQAQQGFAAATGWCSDDSGHGSDADQPSSLAASGAAAASRGLVLS